MNRKKLCQGQVRSLSLLMLLPPRFGGKASTR